MIIIDILKYKYCDLQTQNSSKEHSFLLRLVPLLFFLLNFVINLFSVCPWNQEEH